MNNMNNGNNGNNMNNMNLAPHEAIEVREFVSQEMLGIKKMNASMNMVNDNELKSYMQDSVAAKQNVLQKLQSAFGNQTGTV
ncbi:hypothetical protein [Clostridium peptidivorans]|uniref:hypothetical protein n=1 Tax=Clostridium peptidivorans TaxID=100174 RepID=UPI001FA8A3D8|nr:hypothetical protein [Clostridium peptidivorans]